MRHRKKVKLLGRAKAHRESTVANLASSLIRNDYIVTTVAKARVCKSYVDKIISCGKGEISIARKRVRELLRDKIAADKVMDVLVEKYKDRTGGFVQILKLGRRAGDNAQMAKLVLVDSAPVRKKTTKVKTRKKKLREEKKEKVKNKKGVLDRVKALRKRVGSEQTHSKQIQTKSRSGI